MSLSPKHLTFQLVVTSEKQNAKGLCFSLDHIESKHKVKEPD